LNKRHNACILLAIVALVGSGVACAVPTPSVSPTLPDVTPFVPTTPLPETPEPPPTEADATEPPPTDAAPAEPTTADPTDVPPPTDTETPEPTATSTPEPPPPTATPKPTATPEITIGPLAIIDTGYELVDWEGLPSKEWEGHLRLKFTGGLPPYTSSIGHRDPQEENLHYFRYAACKGASLRADVWSADGQHAHRDIWVEAPWCPTPAP
jgi:hypothetical protein